MDDPTVPDEKTLDTPKTGTSIENTKRAENATPAISPQNGPTASTLPAPDAESLMSTGHQLANVKNRLARHPTIDGYEILEVLGKGGMGIVYKVQQFHPRRIVALKMIRAGEFASEESVQRFRNEIEAAAQLTHANIVHLYEMGTVDDLPYFTMELVEGGSLDRVAAQRTFSFDQAAALVKVLAETIHYAHERGVIHRDLKPGNVLLTPEGQPKITDFGLAKLSAPASDSPATRAGEAMGTPDYMAPEQASGNSMHAGPAADVYSLGVILYELLTGRRPFSGTSNESVVQQILTDVPPSPAHLKPTLPRDLETICLKCLRKDPRQRYATAKDLADDLHRFSDRLPIRGRRLTLPERVKNEFHYRPRRAIGALALICIALASIASLIYADAYVLEHTSYYGNFSKRWGAPIGIQPLSEAAVRRRNVSFKFVRLGRYGPVVRTEPIDSHGRATSDNNPVILWIDGIRSSLPIKARESRYEFRYNDQGFVTEEIGDLSDEKQPLWKLEFDYPEDSKSDPRHQVLAKFMNPRGAVVSDSAGAGAIEFQRNADGFDELVMFIDHRGNPRQAAQSEQQSNFSGVYTTRLNYDKDGLLTRMRFLDAEGKPMPNVFGVFQIVFDYDDTQQLREARFRDAIGNPTLCKLGYYRVSYSYDDVGNELTEEYWGVDGSPTQPSIFSQVNASSFHLEYDSQGRLIRNAGLTPSNDLAFDFLRSYSEDGGRIETIHLYDSGGMRGKSISRVDQRGNHVSSETRGPGGRRLINETKRKFNLQNLVIEEVQRNEITKRETSRITCQYDPKTGRKLSQSSWDESGKKLLGKIDWTYDDLGRPGTETQYDADGTTELSKITYRYDPRAGRVVERTNVMQQNGRPVTLVATWTYNERGDVETENYTDEKGNPVQCPEGYSQLVNQYSPYGRLERQTLAGFSKGQTFSKRVRSYDSHGRLYATEYFDEHDQPARDSALGYSKEVVHFDKIGWPESYEYTGYDGSNNYVKRVNRWDPSGLSTTHTYYDANDQQVRHSDGNLTWTLYLDESGTHKIREVYGGVDPALGYDSLTNNFDADGRMTESFYKDAQGALVRGPLGYARRVVVEDKQRNATFSTYEDEHGKPAHHTDGNTTYIQYWDESRTRVIKVEASGFEPERGFFALSTSFDAAGRTSDVAYFGRDGQPVKCRHGYARVQYEYGEKGEILAAKYSGADGQPLKGKPKVVIVAVVPNTPAAKVNLQPGDVMKSYNGVAVTEQFIFSNEQERIKDQSGEVALEIERNGEHLETLLVPTGKLGILIEDQFSSEE